MRRKLKKKSVFLKILFVVGLILLLGFLLFKVKIFNINKVDITSAELDCVKNEQLKTFLQIIDKSIFSINSADLTKKIKEEFICVKSLTFSRIYPSKINLEVTPRKPLAKLLSLEKDEASPSSSLENIATPSAQASQEGYLVDEEGILFAKTADFFNPLIFIYETDLSIGKKLGQNLENGLKILEKLKIFKVEPTTLVVFDNLFIAYGSPKILFRLDSQVDIQIASLQLILEKAKIDSEELEFIDLRFDKPIIRIAPKKHG